jgi:cupin fold WbuC family metalloprotein
MIKTIDTAKIHEISAQAAASPRLRSNFNLHPELSDPVQRFLNAIEPGSYVRPHRHVEPIPKWELFVVLSGAIAILSFDDAGQVIERVELDALGGNIAAEIPPSDWHSVVALKPGTVLFEFKQGPYAPASAKDFAAWAPLEGEPGSAAMVERLAKASVGDRVA